MVVKLPYNAHAVTSDRYSCPERRVQPKPYLNLGYLNTHNVSIMTKDERLVVGFLNQKDVILHSQKGEHIDEWLPPKTSIASALSFNSREISSSLPLTYGFNGVHTWKIISFALLSALTQGSSGHRSTHFCMMSTTMGRAFDITPFFMPGSSCLRNAAWYAPVLIIRDLGPIRAVTLAGQSAAPGPHTSVDTHIVFKNPLIDLHLYGTDKHTDHVHACARICAEACTQACTPHAHTHKQMRSPPKHTCTQPRVCYMLSAIKVVSLFLVDISYM